MSHVPRLARRFCYFPRVAVAKSTLGTKIPVADYYGFGGQYPRCIFIWGNDPLNADGMIGNRLTPALKAGARLIVADPIRAGLRDHLGSGRADPAGRTPVRHHEAGRHSMGQPPGSPRGVNNTQTVQAAILLMAVTGNLDVPGGMAIWEHGPFVDPLSPEHERPDLLPERSRAMAARWGAGEFTLLGMTHGSLVNRAIVSGELPVQVLFIIGHNFLLTAEHTETARQVMLKVPFSVTIDLFMTPTAALSDLVLRLLPTGGRLPDAHGPR